MSLQPFKLVLRERQILSIGESNICMSSWTKRWVCSTQNHSISPNMPVSLSLSTGRKKGKRRNSTTVTNRWSKSLSFLCASNMTSALWVSQVSCSKCTHTHASTKGQMTIVAYSWKMWMKSRPAAVHSEPEKISFRVIKIMWYNSITSGQHPDSHIQAEMGVWMLGGGETLSQIHAFYWLGLWTPSRPLLMEPDDLLDAHWKAGPRVGAFLHHSLVLTQSSAFSKGWGLGADPLGLHCGPS